MQKQSLFILLLLFPFTLLAQQTIRGTILDKDTQIPLIGATITIQNSVPLMGATTDADGRFRIDNVKLGRYSLTIAYLGYEAQVLSNIEVTAGKEVVLNAGLIESIATLEEVVVTARQDKTKAINELATVSTRLLSIEESSRYAATFADPARQAQNFAGVAGGGDDILNEIVIRGNAPRGLLWRLEGVEIPNPNHFGQLGGSGGGISMLSSNVLSNSDFLTGAFPAEYGNAASGIFDLKFRKGNEEQREFTFGAGFLGIEAAAEGPFTSGGDASYLVNYRFSTLSLLGLMGFDVVGDFLPNYQDLSFNVNIPTKNAGTFNVFGLAGNNWATTEYDSERTPNLSFDETENSATAVVGIKHRMILNDKMYLHTILSSSGVNSLYEVIRKNPDTNNVVDQLEEGTILTHRLSSTLNYKLNARHTFRTGLILNHLDEKFSVDVDSLGTAVNIVDVDGNTNVLQSFAQWRWRMSPSLTLNTGVHYYHYMLNGNQTVEPRLGLRWQTTNQLAFTFGAGLHSRAESLTTYLGQTRTNGQMLSSPNKDLGLTKAGHLVVGTEYSVNSNTRIKVEAYYQHLYDVPIAQDSNNNFSAINAFDAFDFINQQDVFVNEGKGRNYGVEITVERFLKNNFYYLGTLSLYKSEFSNDGNEYFNSRFDGNYVMNLVAGKEFTVGKRKVNTLGINGKFTMSGGLRYTEIDTEQSIAQERTIESSTPFTGQIDPYYRADLGISYKMNKGNKTHTLSLNIQNVTDRLNVFERDSYFDNRRGQVIEEVYYQTSLLPILKYKVNF